MTLSLLTWPTSGWQLLTVGGRHWLRRDGQPWEPSGPETNHKVLRQATGTENNLLKTIAESLTLWYH